MDTYETLLTRRSCRAYDPDRPVDRETLEKVVEAGRFAPSGMGRQPVHFVVVTDRATRDRLSRMNAPSWAAAQTRSTRRPQSSWCW